MIVRLVDELAAADLAGYLGRLLRYDARAVVRLRAAGQTLAVFGHPPLEVITLRTVGVAPPEPAATPPTAAAPTGDGLDLTVSADALLAGVGGRAVEVPTPVLGPPWTGLLPPRAGWRPVLTLTAATVRDAVAATVREGRERIEALAEDERTSAALAEIASTLWSRSIAEKLPLRAAHAAQLLGFMSAAEPSRSLVLHAAGAWLRLEAPYGTVLVRQARRLTVDVS